MRTIEQILISEEETERFGSDIAMALGAGDTIALRGELGAGKTTLARGLIRQLADDDELEVPSPTYTLCQSYELGAVQLFHFDLYRLGDESEIEELGFGEAIENGIVLVEWPERAGDALPEDMLTIELSMHPSGGRLARIGHGKAGLGARLERSLAIRDFLDRTWGKGAKRRFLQGDASTRRYETATLGGETRVLMDSPRQPDGPPVKAPTGEFKPYSRIAHLAEDVTAFIAMDEALRGQGFAAPEIFGKSISEGLLLTEHLGTQGLLSADGMPIPERYCEAARLLAHVHAADWPAAVSGEGGPGETYRHTISRYDRAAILIEASLLADWYVPAMTGEELGVEARAGFFALWDRLAALMQTTRSSLVLRDYHSPNLIWRGEQAFPANIGLIDFQDAMLGPAAYDLASLGQDARVDISPALEQDVIAAYLAEANRTLEHFDTEMFKRDYAVMAAQRATKVLGIFVRLDRRDGKPGYLRHLPRLRDYLTRNLAHPALAEYRAWLASVPGIGMAME
ncbi:MAG: tRNA (adenosine(37)-N6)-threonylcarbamoyltransferase complex ATPase subunit type 1 TsaE [Nitratireductor sp.]|nr:tRNA (adenosine(37)-N6)-threonylcarbamoyltransferase complex ATPase subunit type 1 TsaE [Nitratireductor sp.]